MENTNQHVPQPAKLRLVLDVEYDLAGTPLHHLESLLKELVKRGMAEGLITGNTEAMVEDFSSSVTRIARGDIPDPVRVLAGYQDRELEAGVYGPQKHRGPSGEDMYLVAQGLTLDCLNRTQVTGTLITEQQRKGAIQCLIDQIAGSNPIMIAPEHLKSLLALAKLQLDNLVEYAHKAGFPVSLVLEPEIEARAAAEKVLADRAGTAG